MKWIDTTVGKYCPFVYGNNLPQKKREKGNVPVYGSNGIIDYHNISYVKNPGIIIGRKGSVGAVHLSKGQFWPIDTAFYIEKDSIEELYFAYFLLKSLGLEHMNSDSAVPGLNRNNVHALSIRIPENENDRKSLGAWLAQFNKKLELNTQTNQTLEQIAQALFKSWFVDFEPVKVKISVLEAGGTAIDAELAAMSIIAAKSAEQLAELKQSKPDAYEQLAQTAALFPSAMQESELGKIPESWEVGLLSSEIEVLNGFAFKSKDYIEKGTFVLRTKNFDNGIATSLQDDVFLPESFLESHKKYLCQPFDYHLVMVGASVGNRGMLYPDLLPALRNQNMWCFRPKQASNISRPQVKFILDTLIAKTSGLASGSAREFFRKGDFQNQTICFGSKEIRQLFAAKTTPIFIELASLFAERQLLGEMRDVLLPALLSGEESLFKEVNA